MIKDPYNTQNQEDIVKCQTWDDLFNLTIDITKQEIHCATLALYIEIITPYNKDRGYGIAKFAPIPMTTKQENYEIQAYFFDPFNDPSIGDDNINNYVSDFFTDTVKYYHYKQFKNSELYCIIFTDYNFKSSVETKLQTSTTDKDIHSLSFGVVVNLK